MKTPSLWRYVLLGSGVAGISAAQTIRSLDPQGEMAMVSDDPAGYYSRPGLAYFLTGEISEDVLFPMKKKEIANLHMKWHTQRALKIDPQEHSVELANHQKLIYERLLIATGASASPLQIPGAQAKGVHKLDSLADARAILRQSRWVRSAVVVGGGITALELVEGLRSLNIQVHFFLRGDRYWGNVLDETESGMVLARLEQEGVKIHPQTEIAEILVRRNRVAGVTTRDQQAVKCGLVAFAIGVVPRKELAEAAGIRVERGILTNETLQTSQPDIYAAGDVAQVFDPFSQKSVLDTLWSTARQQGQVAGSNMAGNPTCYEKSVPLNVTRLAGVTTTIIGTVGNGKDPALVGLSRGDSETWRQLPISIVAQSKVNNNRLRLLVGSQNLIGAVLMGDQSLSVPLQELINHRVDILPIRPLLKDGEALGEIISSFWKQWRTRHALR